MFGTNLNRLTAHLVEIVGATQITTLESERDAYNALAPDVVVWPQSADEIAKVLSRCSEANCAVAIIGSGQDNSTRHDLMISSSSDRRMRVALDTRRMTNVLRIDPHALIVECQAGIRFKHLEEALNAHRLTLGIFPTAIENSTIGGLIASLPVEAYSPMTGSIHDVCIGLTAVTPQGHLLHTRAIPRRSAGPEIMRMFIGSRGAFGVIAGASFRVIRQDRLCRASSFWVPTVEHSLTIAREWLRSGLKPPLLRVVAQDQARHEFSRHELNLPVIIATGCYGTEPHLSTIAQEMSRIAEKQGASELPHDLAQTGWRTSLDASHQGIAIARLKYSQAIELLSNIDELQREYGTSFWLDQFTAQTLIMWLNLDTTDAAKKSLRDRARALGAELAPFRFQHDSPWSHPLQRCFDPNRNLLHTASEIDADQSVL